MFERMVTELAEGRTLRLKMFIDGAWSESTGHGSTEVENPANERAIATTPEGTVDDAVAALEAARRAQPAWAALPATDRGRLVSALADAVKDNSAALARVVVAEQGKPLNQAMGEIGATETFLRYAAENARRIEGDILPSDSPDEEVWIRRVPHGVVVGLTAWNYPSALAARKLGPALVAGNTFVLKAHEFTPISGLVLAALAEQVGFPRGVFNVVTGPAAAIKPTNPSSERAPPELIRVKADGGDHAKPRRERGDWMVQVGAYRRKAQANAQIASLNRRFGEHLDQARGEVQAAGHGYYRARFVGLTASAAHSACAALRHHRVTCEALGPS